MSSSKLIQTVSVATRVLTVGVTAALWYWTYKYIYKQVDEYTENGLKNTDDYSDCYKVIRMKIPSYSKGAIIGKNGSTIKKIQEKTKTTIKFLGKNGKKPQSAGDAETNCEWTEDLTKDDNVGEMFEILLIRGLTLRVMEAEKEIKNVINSVPVYKEDHMFINDRFVGKLIGKRGENIKRLKELYKVQIDIDKTNNPERKIIFRGVSENNMECKRDIVKMIDAEMLKERRFNGIPNPRFRNANLPVENTEPVAQTNNVELPIENVESLKPVRNAEEFRQSFVKYPRGLNEKVEIFVSSVVDCGKFYAHVVNDDLVILDNLIEEMTENFNNTPPNRQSSFNVGDIVAGFYDPSLTWQRAKIIGIENNEYEIIYLDYGDCTKLKREEMRIFERDSKYLQLPFQALRLVTHGIRPCAEMWTENEIKEFECLTKVGCSHKVTAILKVNSPLNQEVELIDEETGINIGQKLISDGRAKICC